MWRIKSGFLLFLFSLSVIIAHGQSFSWAKQFAGQESHGRAVVTDALGNVYTTGYFNQTVDFDPGPGVLNLSQPAGAGAYISKLDANGNLVWVKQFVSWNIVSYAIALDASGNVYTTGFFQQIADFDPGPGVYNLTTILGSDVFISKLDNNGNFVWAKQLGGINNIYLGSYSIAIDAGGNVYTTGEFKGMADFDPGPAIFNMTSVNFEDIFISKLDANGNFIWAKQMGGTSFEQGKSIIIGADGNIYSTGFFQGTADFDPGPATFNMTATGASPYISKLDASGNFLWAKQLNNSTQSMGECIITDPSNNVFITGYFRNTLDADPGPGISTMTAVGGSEIDAFLVKLDAAGNFLWAKQFGSTGVDRGHGLSIDVSANIYVTGDFENTIDLDPGPAVFNFTSAGSTDLFILKLNAAGNLTWAKKIGGSGAEISFDVECDASGNIYSTGLFNNTVDFDPDAGVYNVTSTSVDNAFVLKLSRCIASTSANLHVTSCDTYTLNGETYTSSGMYNQVLTNAAGCDSTITLDLTISGSSTTSGAIACDSYTWEGQMYTNSGTYTVVYTNSTGCDSILTLNLTIRNSKTSTINASVCEGGSFEGYTASGTYTDTYVAANGCDSIRTLNLLVKQKSFTTLNAIICEGESYQGHTSAGTFINTYIAANGCDSIHTLNLTVNARKNTPVNASICEGQSYFAGGMNQTSAGIYKDTLASYLGCDSIITTTLAVNAKPRPDLGIDKDLCRGSTIILNPGSYTNYVWHDLSTSPTFTINSTGTYWVTVTTNNCSATDTIHINNILPPPFGFLKDADSICQYEKMQIKPSTLYNSYLWSTGVAQPSITIQNAGEYWLTVKDNNGCSGADTITIFPKICPIGIFVPTAFTPNGDQLNDLFMAKVYGPLASFRLDVFDRGGQLLFRTTDPQKGWDGINSGVSFSSAVFVWQCFYHFEGGKPSYKKGTLTLIR